MKYRDLNKILKTACYYLMCFWGTLTEITEFIIERDRKIIKCAYGEHEINGKATVASYSMCHPYLLQKILGKPQLGLSALIRDLKSVPFKFNSSTILRDVRSSASNHHVT
jgi:hypothetical protein